MSLNGNFTTRFHTHPGLVLLVLYSLLRAENSILTAIQFAVRMVFTHVFNSLHRFTSTKIRHFVTVFACMLRHTCTCNTVPKNTFLCVIYTLNEHTFNGFHFGSIWKTSIFPPFLPPHLYVYLLYACLMSSNMTISQYKHHIWHPCTYAILFMCLLLHGCVLSCISHFSPSFVSHLHVLCCCYRVYRHDENRKSLPDINKHCIDDSFIWW
jgi:hypothetical protein